MAALSPAGLPSREALREFARSQRAAGARGGNGSGAGSADCIVEVGPYTRTRDGKPEQVSGYSRSNPHCGDACDGKVVLATDRRLRHSPAPERRPAAPARAWEGQPNQAWREQIAAEETRRNDGDFGYGMRGQQPGSTALGRYQLLRDPLIDAEWRDRVTGAWTPRARAAGVTSDAEFLANPAAQEAAFNDVMRQNERQLRANGSTRLVGQQVPGLRDGPVPITDAGLAAAAHREGARTVRRYLDHRSANLPAPASIPGRRGDLSRFNEVERRLREFAGTPYQRLTP
jgi:hypothetical protein